MAIHHYLKHNLDALFIATNAPVRNAFNRVESRMTPVSRELSGLILAHEFWKPSSLTRSNNSGAPFGDNGPTMPMSIVTMEELLTFPWKDVRS